MNHKKIAFLLRRVNPQTIWGAGKIVCPFHDDHSPSLEVYEDGLYCWACARQYSALKVLKAQGTSHEDAVAVLEKHQGKQPVLNMQRKAEPIPWERVGAWSHALLEDEEAQVYLRDRGILRGAMEVLSLGWTDGRQYSIPHCVGNVIENVKFRVHPDYRMDGEPKYTSSSGRGFSQPYPYDVFVQMFDEPKHVFVTEGEFDAIVLLQAGLPAVSLPSGVTHLLSKWVGFFSRFERVYLLFDQDTAGWGATERVKRKGKRTKESQERWIHAEVEPIPWKRAWGKDVTEARDRLIPYLKVMYAS